MMFSCFAATSDGIRFEQAPVPAIHIWLSCGEAGADWRGWVQSQVLNQL